MKKIGRLGLSLKCCGYTLRSIECCTSMHPFQGQPILSFPRPRPFRSQEFITPQDSVLLLLVLQALFSDAMTSCIVNEDLWGG